MTKYLSHKSLTFLNRVQFLKRGRLYSENIYATTRTMHNLKIPFTTDDGQIVTFSSDPNNEMHIDKVLQDYDEYKKEKANDE